MNAKEQNAKMIMPGPMYPPYYPDEDRQLAGELMDIAGKLMDMASRVLKPDHYWKGIPGNPDIYPMQKKPQDDDRDFDTAKARTHNQ